MASSETDTNPSEERSAPPPYELAPLVTAEFPNECYYDMQNKKGLLVIFNHYKYEKGFYKKRPLERRGTAADTMRLRNTFEMLSFDVVSHNDLTYNQIMDVASAISQRDHSSTSCLTVCVLTHGDYGGTLYAADRTYKLSELCAQFSSKNCPSLAKAPKLFFIQACRGGMVDDGLQIDSEGGNFVRIPSTADILVMYSSVEEYVSFRDINGSWFIQALCDMLLKHHDSHHLLEILTFVNYQVAYSRESYNPGRLEVHGKKQMPEVVSKLTKLLRFTKP